jgi:hypothetical protein
MFPRSYPFSHELDIMARRLHLLILFYLLTVLQASASGGGGGVDPEVKIELDRQEFTPGDVVTVRLEVTSDIEDGNDLKVDISRLMGLEIIDSGKTGARRFWYRMQVTRLGHIEIGPFKVRIGQSGENTRILLTPPFQSISRPPVSDRAQDTDILPIKPLAPVSVERSYFREGLIVFFFFIGGASLFLYSRSRSRSRQSSKEKTSGGIPYQEALAALDGLEGDRLFENGRVKEAFFALSEIFRTYLEGLYRIPAKRCSTEEIDALLEKDCRPNRELVIGFLRFADRVKFAGYLPSLEEYASILKGVRGFILNYESPKEKERDA